MPIAHPGTARNHAAMYQTAGCSWLRVAGPCCRVPRAAWQMEAAGRPYSLDVRGLLPPKRWLRCAVVCHAQRGRWRPKADDTGFGFDLDFDFRFCPAGLTGRALLLFLTSPPRIFLDGGVRSGTVCAAGFARPGRPAGHPRAARVHSVRTRGWAGVPGLCGCCVVTRCPP